MDSAKDQLELCTQQRRRAHKTGDDNEAFGEHAQRVTTFPCPFCGERRLRIEDRFVAKEIGTFSLAGAVPKMSGTMWPHLVCDGCQASGPAYIRLPPSEDRNHMKMKRPFNTNYRAIHTENLEQIKRLGEMLRQADLLARAVIQSYDETPPVTPAQRLAALSAIGWLDTRHAHDPQTETT